MLKYPFLILKPFSPEDAEFALDILTNREIAKSYMLPDYEKREDALPLFYRMMDLSHDKQRYVRGIYLDGRLIGHINDVGITDRAVEVGYVIHPDYQSRGFMTEALNTAITELFSMGYREITAGAFDWNLASIRVMVKAGMTPLPHQEEIEYRNKTHSCIYYSLKKKV